MQFHVSNVTSEGVVSHNVLYYQQLSNACYQVSFYKLIFVLRNYRTCTFPLKQARRLVIGEKNTKMSLSTRVDPHEHDVGSSRPDFSKGERKSEILPCICMLWEFIEWDATTDQHVSGSTAKANSALKQLPSSSCPHPAVHHNLGMINAQRVQPIND